MAFHDLFRNGKPQPCAAHGAAAGLIHAVKTFKYAWQVFTGDTHAGIPHGYFVILRVLPDINTNLRLFKTIFDGVRYDVVYNLPYSVPVAIDYDIMRVWLKRQFLIFRLGVYFILPHRNIQKFIHFDFRNIQPHLLIVKARQLQQIPHKERHAVCLAVDNAEEIQRNFSVLNSPFDECFRIAFHCRQRRTQLMRNICHKFLTHIVQLFLLGNILQNNYNAFNTPRRIIIRRKVGINELFSHREYNFFRRLVSHIQIN